MTDFTYDISSTDPYPGQRITVPFTSELAGTDNINEECMSLVYMTLDFVFADGSMDTLWTEGDEPNDESDSVFALVTT
jgi:hypothetical protein